MTATLATLQVFALRAALNREQIRVDELEAKLRRHEALEARALQAVQLAMDGGRREVLVDLEVELAAAVAVGPPPLLRGEGGRA